MAEKKQQDEGSVEAPTTGDAIVDRQVKPIQDRPKDEQVADLTHPEDIKKGVLEEPEHEADQTPYPTGPVPPQERPPFSTGRPDVPMVASMVTGAGAHTPPDPEQFDADGRPRNLK